MVVKLSVRLQKQVSAFESSVISYGSQTLTEEEAEKLRFESSVISYGSQTSVHYKYIQH